LPLGKRERKFEALAKLRLGDGDWIDAPSGWRDRFLPASQGQWSEFPAIEELFVYNGSGVMPGRTWIIAPDADSLRQRWKTLIEAPATKKDDLLQPHLNHGKLGDRDASKTMGDALPGFRTKKTSVAAETNTETDPIAYGFRSFDRQWIIPDKRVINRPNPELWQSRSERQIYLTALLEESPPSGPAATLTSLVPDLHHYKGSFGGRVFPLWRDEDATDGNFPYQILATLSARMGISVGPEDLF